VESKQILSLKLPAPAKINLFLAVTGKRQDGYHDLISLISAVELHDTLSFSVKPGGNQIRVVCSHPDVPENETNLAWRAACLFMTSFKRHDTVTITIEKRIPVAAGLGGGSSDAATVLLGLNRLYNNPFSINELMSMGLAIGADVPFFIFGKPAVARGIGEKLEPCTGLCSFPVLLVCPRISVSTRDVYKKLNLGLTKCEIKINNFVFGDRVFDVQRHLCNDLETVSVPKYPVIRKAKQALLSKGARGVLMSGSGPAVFGLFFDAAVASNAGHFLADNEDWLVYLTKLSVSETSVNL